MTVRHQLRSQEPERRWGRVMSHLTRLVTMVSKYSTVNIQHSTTRAAHTFTHQQPAGSHRSQPVLTRTDYLLKDWPQSGLSMSVKRYPWWQHAHITTCSRVIITIIRVKTIKSMMVVYGDIYPVWPCVRRLLGFLCRFFEACTQRATTTATTTTLQQYTFSH